MPTQPVGHLMEAIERHLKRDGGLTCRELCARTGYAPSTMHASLMRLVKLKRVMRARCGGGWSTDSRGGSPPFFYELPAAGK